MIRRNASNEELGKRGKDPESGQAIHEDGPLSWNGPLVELPPSKINSNTKTQISKRKRILQVFSICAFLMFWVANGEILQGLTTGSLPMLLWGGGHDSATTDNNGAIIVAYDQPAFVTWFSYNYMMLSIFIVYPYVRSRNWTIRHYLHSVWAGKLGVRRAVASCVFIAYTLQLLNILMIVGLGCISVSISNAVYQTQTLFTVSLSVCWLHDDMSTSKITGVFGSLLGVAVIVLPPLLDENEETSPSSSSCLYPNTPMVFGMLATLCSAAIGGSYLVSWRVFDERRNLPGTSMGRLEGLMDTQMTLTLIGFGNLVFGWPTFVLAHWSGLESFQLPPTTSHWWILMLNGVMEYLFDASCAIAIFMTSPVVVAISSPLTIPLSMLADEFLFGTGGIHRTLTWLGVGLILAGIVILETNIGRGFVYGSFKWKRSRPNRVS